jgi:hypothetical protein
VASGWSRPPGTLASVRHELDAGSNR